MAGFVDLTGHQYGRLTVLRRGMGRITANGRSRATWVCRCECGTVVEVQSDSLRTGNTKSCGCYNHDRIVERNIRHGYASRSSRSPEYEAWEGMKKRCGRDPDYLDVKVCDKWANSFADFLHDMGPKPAPHYSIDRIDPYGDYEPDNCRWLPLRAQAANKRNTRWVVWEGRKVSAGVLAKELGIYRSSLYRVLDRGYSIEDAINHLRLFGVANRSSVRG